MRRIRHRRATYGSDGTLLYLAPISEHAPVPGLFLAETLPLDCMALQECASRGIPVRRWLSAYRLNRRLAEEKEAKKYGRPKKPREESANWPWGKPQLDFDDFPTPKEFENDHFD